MFRNTRSRWAALTSGALIAGGLVVAPAVAGLSTASAAPVALKYTCAATTPFGALSLPGTVTLDVAPPATVAPGAEAPVGITAKLAFEQINMGPVSELAATFDIPLTAGGDTATFTTPSQTAPVSALVYDATGSVDLTAPAAAGDVPITVGTIAANFSAMGMAIPGTCTPDAGQDQTVGSLKVEGDGPVEPGDPEGILYSCTYGTFPNAYEAYLDIDADLPESIDQGSGFNPDLDATLTWTEEAADGFRSIGLGVEEGSATLNLATVAGQGEGTAELPLDETDIPAEGPAVWTGSGEFGVLDTSVPGPLTLSVGDATIDLRATVRFTPGVYTDATFTCAVAEGEATEIGSVTVNQTAGPVEVTGTVSVKGAAKVGKKLTAVPGKAPGATTSYQWLSNGKAINKATGKTLKLTNKLKGKKVSVRVTYSQADHFDVVQTSKAVKVKPNKKK